MGWISFQDSMNLIYKNMPNVFYYLYVLDLHIFVFHPYGCNRGSGGGVRNGQWYPKFFGQIHLITDEIYV